MPEINKDVTSDWTKWSMLLIEGFQSMKTDIAELYELIHSVDTHSAQERQNIIVEVSKELQELRKEFQKEIFKINIELTKIEMKIATWSAIFASVGTIVGSVVAYSLRSWIAHEIEK